MSKLILNPIIFIVASSLLIIGGSTIKVDKYESNALKRLNDSYSKMLISLSSFEKVNIEVDEYFNYWVDGKESSKKVVSVTRNNNNYEVIFLTADNTYVTMISYKIGKNSLWSEIFKWT